MAKIVITNSDGSTVESNEFSLGKDGENGAPGSFNIVGEVTEVGGSFNPNWYIPIYSNIDQTPRPNNDGSTYTMFVTNATPLTVNGVTLKKGDIISFQFASIGDTGTVTPMMNITVLAQITNNTELYQHNIRFIFDSGGIKGEVSFLVLANTSTPITISTLGRYLPNQTMLYEASGVIVNSSDNKTVMGVVIGLALIQGTQSPTLKLAFVDFATAGDPQLVDRFTFPNTTTLTDFVRRIT